jgi:hypothetical protein
MGKTVEIDHRHGRAITQKIGECLRDSLAEDRQLPPYLASLLDRLRQVERRTGLRDQWSSSRGPPRD